MKKGYIEGAWKDPRIYNLMNPIVAFLKSKNDITVSARGFTGRHYIWSSCSGDTMGTITRHESLTVRHHCRLLYKEHSGYGGMCRISYLNVRRIGKYGCHLIGLLEEYEEIWKKAEDRRQDRLVRKSQRRNLKTRVKVDKAFGRARR